MERLTPRKKLTLVKLYLSGLSYDEIAARAGVSKGSVANVVTELKEGSYPEAADVGEHIELLRDLAVDLKRSRLSPGQCATGLILLNRINELRLDPADIDRWPIILKSVRNEDDAKAFVHLVYSIQEVQKRTGLDLEALDSKVRELEKKAADLEPISDKVQDCQRQLTQLTRQREKLASSVAMLEQKRKLLSPQVKDLEKRERTLSRRIVDLEPKAQKAEATLSALKGEIQKLEDKGYTPKELAEFNEKLKAIAQHHAIEPSELRNRLLHELEALDEGLSLETLTQNRQQQLEKAEEDLGIIRSEIKATRASLGSLNQEKKNLEASIKETREKISREIAKVIPLAQETVHTFAVELQRGTDEALGEVRRLREEAIEVGIEIGRCRGMLQVSEWLNELHAMVRGEEDIEGKRVRIIVLSVVRAFHTWLKHQDRYSLSFTTMLLTVERLINELETWET